MSSSKTLLAILTLAPIGVTAAAEWNVVSDSSSVTMYVTKQGTWFNGQFREFTAAIDFDVADPQAGTISGTVKTASIDTGDAQNDAYVLQYLEVEAFDEAHFVSRSIRVTPEAYEAAGELTLLGVTRPVSLYFTFATEGASSAPVARSRFVGQMTIDRFEFGIASDVDPTQAGRQVTVQIELDLER